MFDIKGILNTSFGISTLNTPLFGLLDACLRFELGGDIGNAQKRAETAIKTAEEIYSDLFSNTKDLILILHFYEPARLGEAVVPESIALLEKQGFLVNHLYSLVEEGNGEDLHFEGFRYWYVSNQKQDLKTFKIFIECAVKLELGLEPSIPLKAYFIDANQSIIFHVYDDRGLDIVAKQRDILYPILTKYSDRLIDSTI